MPSKDTDVAFRRGLRTSATPAEHAFWDLVRERRLDGHKFRRQHQIGGWTVDFACLTRQLVVELDGDVHDLPEQTATDAVRDAWLTNQGWTVLRFRNSELFADPDAVLERVRGVLAASTPRPRAGEGSAEGRG